MNRTMVRVSRILKHEIPLAKIEIKAPQQTIIAHIGNHIDYPAKVVITFKQENGGTLIVLKIRNSDETRCKNIYTLFNH